MSPSRGGVTTLNTLSPAIMSSDWDYEEEYAPAISRDGFTFRGDRFYVVVDGNQHEREDAQQLYKLLTYTPPPPTLTKKGTAAKRQPAPHKDHAAHFYCAQLIHYGLKPLKTREPAKKKLLAAFGTDQTLSAPASILQLEISMKEEWKKANEVAEKKYREEALERDRREREERQQIDIWEKERREKQEEKQKTMMKDFFGAFDAAALADSDEDEPEAPRLSKAQMRKEIASLSDDQIRKLLLKLLADVPEVEDAMKIEIEKARAQARKAKAKAKAGPSKSQRALSVAQWKGLYNVYAPKLADNWDDAEGPLELEVYPSAKSSHLWAAFNFGIISGVIRSSDAPPKAVGDKIHFVWRGRESGEGVMTFADCNQGAITFLGDGKIHARMTGDLCGKFEFFGKQCAVKKNGGDPVRKVSEWKHDWRGINWSSYNAASLERWGKWGGEPKSEGPAYSDTSEEHPGSDDDEDGGLDLWNFAM